MADVSLPPSLIAALDAALEGVGRTDLAARAARQSAAYRGGGTSAGVADGTDALAYAIARMPATYAAVRAVLARLAEAVPELAPQSLADIGAGPGTASWAALDAWPLIARVTMLDRNPAFRALASNLARGGSVALAQADVAAGDVGATQPAADLVIASYVLAELPLERAGNAAVHLWQAAQTLVLVEPGTPAGFARIRAARATLIAAGAQVAAPCTHENICPMCDPDWCHFSQRLPRSRDHMRAKEARVPFEDERYSYLAVTRLPVAAAASRIVAPPAEAKPGVTLRLCDGGGLRDHIIARRDKPAFTAARRLRWGDPFNP